MLLPPINDKQCLAQAHKEAERLAKTHWYIAFVRQFRSLAELIAYIRSLDQRDDLGDPEDGPRIPCEVSQRLRLNPRDPNCFERLVMFLAAALILDPATAYSSASLVMDAGWHTFPIVYRDGRPHVVVLDPMSPPRNAMLATAYRAQRLTPLSGDHLVPWFAAVARNACCDDGSEVVLNHALSTLRNELITGEPIEDFGDWNYVMDQTAADAEMWGGQGRAAVHQIHRSIRNLSINLDKGLVRRFLDKVGKAAEELAPDAIKAALIAKFGPGAGLAFQGVDLVFKEGEQSDGTSKVKKDKRESSGLVIQPKPATATEEIARTTLAHILRHGLHKMNFTFRK